MTGVFLSRHKHLLYWLHVASVLATLCLVLPALAWSGAAWLSPGRAVVILALATLAWCQNIGLVHHCAHHLPRGPRWLAMAVARLLHDLGGLTYTRARFAHRLHHVYLGTAKDPDRLGYETTTTLARRLRYLVLIGPLRARFAPVDITPARQAMSPRRRAVHDQMVCRDRRRMWMVQVLMVPLYGAYYPVVLAALLFANVLSNAREMAEHGNHGRAAYVDIRVSLLGVLFFSTPGFWFHGLHHRDSSIHYLDLPRIAAERSREQPFPVDTSSSRLRPDLPSLRRSGVLSYLLFGAAATLKG